MPGIGLFGATYYASYADAITYGINVSMNLNGTTADLLPPHFIGYFFFQPGSYTFAGVVNDQQSSLDPTIIWRAIDANTGILLPTLFNIGDLLPDNHIGGDQTYGVGYYLYPFTPCFLEGSEILCQINGVDTYVPIESIKVGTLVKTSLDGYKKVEVIGNREIVNLATDDRIDERLYKCSPEKYPQLTKDLYLTGGHSILVDELTDTQREETMKQLTRLFVTDKKYRLLACIDERAEPWNSAGTYTVWHFALENSSPTSNYGVYANGGLLVESSSLNFMKTKSNMTLV